MNDSRDGAGARFEYVLGDSSLEAQRLDQQAQLWDPYACQLLDRIGIRAGWRVLEVGPGRGSVHLELRRRVQRPVDLVERSPIFVAALRERTRADGHGDGLVWQSTHMSGPAGSPAWHWLFRYFASVRERIASIPPLDPRKAARLWEAWCESAFDRHAFVVAPTMVDVIGQKPGASPPGHS